MPRNAIGQFEFIRLDGALEMPLEEYAVESRAGIDGYAIYETGKRGVPMRVVSLVDCPNWSYAQMLYESYTTQIGNIVMAWQNYVTPSITVYFIQRVNLLSIQNNLFGIGGLVGGATVLRCGWELIPLRRK